MLVALEEAHILRPKLSRPRLCLPPQFRCVLANAKQVVVGDEDEVANGLLLWPRAWAVCPRACKVRQVGAACQLLLHGWIEVLEAGKHVLDWLDVVLPVLLVQGLFARVQGDRRCNAAEAGSNCSSADGPALLSLA